MNTVIWYERLKYEVISGACLWGILGYWKYSERKLYQMFVFGQSTGFLFTAKTNQRHFQGEIFPLIMLTLQNVWGGFQSWIGCRSKSLTLTVIVLPSLSDMCPFTQGETHGLWWRRLTYGHCSIILWIFFLTKLSLMPPWSLVIIYYHLPSQIAQPWPHPLAVFHLYISFSVIFGRIFVLQWQLQSNLF